MDDQNTKSGRYDREESGVRHGVETVHAEKVKKIKVIRILFDSTLDFDQLVAFRKAVIKVAGQDNLLFHNHTFDDKLIYKYPMVQFKLINGNPVIWAAEEATSEVLKLLGLQTPLEIEINNEKVFMSVQSVQLKQYVVQVWDKMFSYKITNWLALNSENYDTYQQLFALKDRVDFLTKILVAHIISFAEGIHWNIDKHIELYINDIHAQRWVKYKDVGFLAFDVSFTTNVSLPPDVGLGKAVRLGFGTVRKMKRIAKTKKLE